METAFIDEKLNRIGNVFSQVLNDYSETNLAYVMSLGYNKQEAVSVILFDWFQGVCLYGFYKLYKHTQNEKYLKILTDYYQKRIEEKLPPKNINSMCPLLTLCFLNEELKNKEYEKIIKEWAEYLYYHHPRIEVGGFQHVTYEKENPHQLWDDTLFMSVLFLAKVGAVYQIDEYVQEAIYQFRLHAKYLKDPSTGLWYHGYSFIGNHNFSKALWGRGNAWITIFIPELLEILEGYPLAEEIKTEIITVLQDQVAALTKFQDASGLWHTLIDEPTSYLEASATAGFGYGILKSCREGYIEKSNEVYGIKALEAVLANISPQGILENVSDGTAMGETKDYYRNIPLNPKPYGQALAILCLLEGLKLKK